MSYPANLPVTVFDGSRRIGAGPLAPVVGELVRYLAQAPQAALAVFDDATGERLELDLRGTESQAVQRLAPAPSAPDPDTAEPAPVARGPGRPRLGVVAREVTLLPRHWEWLAEQPGGASVTLRKLVEAARRSQETADRTRRAQEAAYRFMLSMAGDAPGYEEALRALYAGDAAQFDQHVAAWPEDVRAYARQLAFGG